MTDETQTEASAPIPKAPVETLVMIEGGTMPANLQPPQHALQGAFRRGSGPTLRIVIDMAAALPIAQEMVRQARAAAFVRNDAATVQAFQRKNETALLAAAEKGEQLRDATADARLTDAKTPDELLAAVDAITSEF